jgi:hypothetical protein
MDFPLLESSETLCFLTKISIKTLWFMNKIIFVKDKVPAWSLPSKASYLDT